MKILKIGTVLGVMKNIKYKLIVTVKMVAEDVDGGIKMRTEYKIKPKQTIKSFKIFTDDTDEDKVLVGNDIETALEILENNGYIIEVEYKNA